MRTQCKMMNLWPVIVAQKSIQAPAIKKSSKRKKSWPRSTTMTWTSSMLSGAKNKEVEKSFTKGKIQAWWRKKVGNHQILKIPTLIWSRRSENYLKKQRKALFSYVTRGCPSAAETSIFQKCRIPRKNTSKISHHKLHSSITTTKPKSRKKAFLW